MIIVKTWAEAKKLRLIRSAPSPIYQNEILEPGVNFFVLMLEKLGAVTHYSCEGHPNGFYILFSAPLRTAKKVRDCGYFIVELEPGGKWSLRVRTEFYKRDPNRATFFRLAATAWHGQFGDIEVNLTPRTRLTNARHAPRTKKN